MQRKEFEGVILWLTGLSGAGKSTLAARLDKALVERVDARRMVYNLDGDRLREGLNRDLSFSPVDRMENIRRFAEVAALFQDAGAIVIVSMISPYRESRAEARRIGRNGQFIEIFVDTPVTVCQSRDPKGLYKKAREGKITDMTGIQAPYEAPEDPDIHIHTESQSPDESIAEILTELQKRNVLE